MFNMLSSMFAILGSYKDPEYNNLSKDEKDNLDYMDSCIASENKNISDAAFKTMMLILELSVDSDKYQPEEIHVMQEEILKGLSSEEVSAVNKFIPACINSMGIFSEESKQERRLKRERKE